MLCEIDMRRIFPPASRMHSTSEVAFPRVSNSVALDAPWVAIVSARATASSGASTLATHCLTRSSHPVLVSSFLMSSYLVRLVLEIRSRGKTSLQGTAWR